MSANPQTETKTMGLWDRDVCEAFLAPNPEHPNRYFEFEAAPTGEWVDLAVHLKPGQRETEWDFESGMTTAARIGDNQSNYRDSDPLGGSDSQASTWRAVAS